MFSLVVSGVCRFKVFVFKVQPLTVEYVAFDTLAG